MSKRNKSRKTLSPTEMYEEITGESLIEESSNKNLEESKENVVEITAALKSSSSAPEVSQQIVDDNTQNKQIIIKSKKIDSVVIKNTDDADEYKVVSQDVLFIRNYIDNYKKLLNKKSSDKSQVIKAFVQLISYAVNNQHKVPVLNELLKFFRENRNGILSETVALQGITSISENMREKVRITYGLLVATVDGIKSSSIDFSYASSILGNNGFVAFIRSRMKK